MAEALFRKIAAEKMGCREWELRERGIDVFSAGIAAAENFPASREAIDVLQEYNIDLSQHLSQQVEMHMVENSNLILTMTSRHRSAINQACPVAADRTFLLDKSERDVPDPIGQGVEAYKNCVREIEMNVRMWVDELFEKEPKHK